jgi:hypothetical protein
VSQTSFDPVATTVSDGVETTDAAQTGNGSPGVVARETVHPDGTADFYLCLVVPDGSAGCYLVVNNQFTQLATVPAGTIQFSGDTAQLTLAVVGQQLTFAVDGTIVLTATDGQLASGGWGVYGECGVEGGGCAVSFGEFSYGAVPADFKLGQ